MEGYYALFGVTAAAIVCLEWPRGVREDKANTLPSSFLSFRRNYLFVYSLMMGAQSLK